MVPAPNTATVEPREDLRQLGRVPATREPVGQQEEVVLQRVAGLAGQRDAIRIGIRHPEPLGLRPPEGAHPGVAVRGAELAGTYAQAGR
jgi:hypothetical protein